MQSFATVLCQIWGQFRWILVLYVSNVLFWSGSIKRPDLQTAYRYRVKSFRVDSNMIGRSADTRSDLMRASHSWTPKLNILEILTHFWPASEPCRQATIKDMDFIFPVRTLPTLTYRPRKYKGMDMLSWSTVVCHIWGQFRWNLVLYGSKCPILKRVHQTARSPNGLWIQGWILQGRFQYNRAICSYQIWPYAGQSHVDPKIEYSWNFNTFLTCIGACRQATIKDMALIFPVRTLPTLSYRPRKYKGMDMLSWSTVVCHIWGQFRWNLVLYGSKCPILKRVHQTARSPNGLWMQGWILQGRFQYDRAIYLGSYKVWPYAGKSQLDTTIEYSWNFKTFMTCIGAL